MDRVKEIVKKNLISIICAVVAVLALVAVWPIEGKFEELQTQVGQRSSVYNQLNELLTKERRKPVVTLADNPTPEPLDRFPTEQVIAKGNEVKAAIEAEAQALYKEAVRLNQGDKKPLVPDALPRPRSNQSLIKFRQDYLREMDYANPDPAKRKASMPHRIMRAGMAPTDPEIAEERKKLTDFIKQTETVWDKGKPTNESQVQAKINETMQTLPDEMRMKAVKEYLLYLDKDSFDVAAAMQTTGVPQLPAVYWAQVGLWLQEDVCRAIAEANAGANNVTESTVKRLVKLTLPDMFTRPTAPMPTPTEGGEAGTAPPPADPSQPLQKNYVESPTGRYTNPLYDVIRFRLSLIVEADRVPLVLQALSKDRFITVYEMNILSVDSGEQQALGYIYGSKPVVQLDMQCEALFMREWTKQYMPPIVKMTLGIVEEPTPPAQ